MMKRKVLVMFGVFLFLTLVGQAWAAAGLFELLRL
jgi:hypothetical protein